MPEKERDPARKIGRARHDAARARLQVGLRLREPWRNAPAGACERVRGGLVGGRGIARRGHVERGEDASGYEVGQGLRRVARDDDLREHVELQGVNPCDAVQAKDTDQVAV
jgi:hypothetical protein